MINFIPAFTTGEAGTRFNDPGRMDVRLSLPRHCSTGVQPVPKTAYRRRGFGVGKGDSPGVKPWQISSNVPHACSECMQCGLII